ncbi:hypothetical protein [Adhaeretor mobilis]|uniref:hypothetical protein n=1 Tax=Adhaeretor mobilis TaxID=1930276 RepID=UPI00119F1B1F|nr:hypothetical protein [Adhaeretor mobilis]
MIVFGEASPALAAKPRLEFDFGRAVACRVVASEDPTGDPVLGESALGEPEKLIEFTLPVSVQLLSGDMRKVLALRIALRDNDQKMIVHDFCPKTRLESQLTGEVHRTHKVETNHSLSATLGGEAPVLLGDLVAQVTPSVSGATGKLDVVTEIERRRPPKDLLIASGTTNQRHGVFFRLKPSPQTTLEGVHKLTVILRVPPNWRGDVLQVSASATGNEKWLWMSSEATFAQLTAPVALYLEGDPEARFAAERYLRQ